VTAWRGAALQVAGKAGTFSMEKPSDPVQLARLARLAYQSGAWRTVPKTGGAYAKFRYLLKSKAPETLLLPETGLRALVKAGPGCGWCAVTVLAALTGLDGLEGPPEREQELEPEPVTLELLGQPCSGCRARHADRAARREAARRAEAGRAARAAIGVIEREDGRLAAKVAELGLRLRLPPGRVADLVASASARPVAVPGIFPHLPSSLSAPQRPATRQESALACPRRPTTGRSRGRDHHRRPDRPGVRAAHHPRPGRRGARPAACPGRLVARAVRVRQGDHLARGGVHQRPCDLLRPSDPGAVPPPRGAGPQPESGMAAVTVTSAARRRRRRVLVQADPCSCDGSTLCLFHFDQLSPDQRAAARARSGVRDPQHKHRAAWAGR
jgi:hypothetical protein